MCAFVCAYVWLICPYMAFVHIYICVCVCVHIFVYNLSIILLEDKIDFRCSRGGLLVGSFRHLFAWGFSCVCVYVRIHACVCCQGPLCICFYICIYAISVPVKYTCTHTYTYTSEADSDVDIHSSEKVAWRSPVRFQPGVPGFPGVRPGFVWL